MNSPRDLTGRRFFKLEVLRLAYVLNHRTYWDCRCDCGRVIAVRRDHILDKRQKSCGCELKNNGSVVHGHKRRGHTTGLYSSWSHMMQRCFNSKDKDFKNYGARGISVCLEWRIFSGFQKDMIHGWSPGLTIERKNVNENYEPSNCIWIENELQSKNRR